MDCSHCKKWFDSVPQLHDQLEPWRISDGVTMTYNGYKYRRIAHQIAWIDGSHVFEHSLGWVLDDAIQS